ncbi:MAG TPA: hypothetical protein VE818_08670, partial [Nitrososphaeraceae archaeon]|nr:hypothetical protein [Nitrososphaeraceae archaeon]
MKKITTLLLLQLSLAAVIVLQILTMAIPLPILQIYAQQQSNTGITGVSQSLSGLINSVALLVGVVAPLIVS